MAWAIGSRNLLWGASWAGVFQILTVVRPARTRTYQDHADNYPARGSLKILIIFLTREMLIDIQAASF